MRIRHLLSGLVLCTSLFAASLAHADVDDAESAFRASDFATARKELQPLGESLDARVYMMLGIMNRDGKAGPVDLKEAYRDFSLAFMYSDDGGLREEAFGERTLAARKMSPDDIVASEQAVVATVRARLTEDGLRREVEAIHKDLLACRQECEEIAARAFRLGPAGKDLIPDLEQLMTRDIMWLPREWYAFALAGIGTEAVPALVRVMTNDEEMRTEGFWNLQQVTRALAALGPTAFGARPALLAALTRDYSGKGSEYEQFFQELGSGDPEDMIVEIKGSVARALVLVRDPDHEVHDKLVAYMKSGASVSERLLAAWVIGASYREFDPVVTLTADALASSSPAAQKLGLRIVPDLQSVPQLRPRVQRLREVVRKLAGDGNPDVAAVARDTLNLFVGDRLDVAAEAMRKQDHAAARAEADAALEINPWSADAMTLRAEARRKLGDIDGAVADYLAAMNMRDYSFDVQIDLQAAGAWPGEVTGENDDATRKALEKCIRDDACFKKYQRFR